jgi:protocatechuate 3,4-dioxygenase beta subunit
MHTTCQEEVQQRLQQQQQHHQHHQHQQRRAQGPSNPYLLFYGRLRDDVGEPVEDAQVQFWHADYNGNYFHPGDDLDGYELLSDTFSYFGTAETDALGNFAFKTFRPGLYAGRPITHIHFKVWYKNGRELLTSQFYFDDENASLMFDDMLVLKLQESIQDDGNSLFHATKKVVVNMNKGGLDKFTPVQTEGPFYPLVNFFDVGNDMTAGLLNRFAEFPSDVITDAPILESILSLSSAPSFAPPTVEPSSTPIIAGNDSSNNNSNNSNNITDGNSTDYDDDFVDFDSDEDVDGDGEIMISSDENEEEESIGNLTTTIIGDDDNDEHNDNDNDTKPDNDNNATATTTKKTSSKPTIAPTENPEKSKADNNNSNNDNNNNDSKKTETPTSNPTIEPTEKPKETKPVNEIPVEPYNNNEQEQKEEDPSVSGLPLEDNVSPSIKTSTTINDTITIATDPGGSTRFLRSNNINNNNR